MNHRPHSAHSGQNSAEPSATVQTSVIPSQILQPESEHVRALLEELDDVVFMAIRGDEASLTIAGQLWPRVVQEIGWELVEESREQYLRYASDLSQRMAREELRDPKLAIAALEVIELLSR